MKRSITSLICGLIGSLFSLFWGFVCGITGNALSIIAAEANVLNILGWLAFLGAIAGIVGASLCVKQARKGAICLSAATALCGALQIYLFAHAVGSAMLMTSIIVFLLPTILLLVAAIFGFLAKEKAGSQQQAPVQTKTMEQELSELKGMLDKGLITEDEFVETKKSILIKYTK